MSNRDAGFSMVEMLIVLVVMGIIAAWAIPNAYLALKAYRLHNDAAAVAAEMNVARFRATSQYAPYRLHVDVLNNSYYIERLCGDKTVAPGNSDSSCTALGATPYTSFSAPRIEGGVQSLSYEDSFTETNPAGTNCPPPAPESLTACSGDDNFYFNTRGMPVRSDGSPLGNGGRVIYLTSAVGLSDAVVVTVGGRVGTYNWDTNQTVWYSR